MVVFSMIFLYLFKQIHLFIFNLRSFFVNFVHEIILLFDFRNAASNVDELLDRCRVHADVNVIKVQFTKFQFALVMRNQLIMQNKVQNIYDLSYFVFKLCKVSINIVSLSSFVCFSDDVLNGFTYTLNFICSCLSCSHKLIFFVISLCLHVNNIVPAWTLEIFQ